MMHEFRPDAVKETTVNAQAHGGVVAAFTSLVAVLFGLLPLLFIPQSFITLSHSKVLIIAGALLALLVSGMLLTLTRRVVPLRLNLGMSALMLLALVTALSALLSGNALESFVGTNLPVHAGATLVVAVVSGIGAFVFAKRQRYLTLFFTTLLLGGGALFIFSIFKVVFRDLFDPRTLGAFSTLTATPMGSWNNIGIFAILIFLLTALALVMLPLRRWHRVGLFKLGAIALFTLLMVNVTLLWMLLTVLTAGFLFYLYTDRGSAVAMSARVFVGLAALLSVGMLFFGSLVGTVVPASWQVAYMEVYPSLTSTTEIATKVFKQDPLFGVGPNYFNTAWEQHKNPLIYQTEYWNASFDNGYSYLSTTVVELGILGVLAWVFILYMLLFLGVRVVQRPLPQDPTARFLLVASLVGALYLFSVLFLFNVAVSILLFFFIFLGIFFSIEHTLERRAVTRFRIPERGLFRLGVFVLITAASLGTISGMVFFTNHYLAVSASNKALATMSDPAEVERVLIESYNRFPDSEIAYTLSQLELTRMREVLVAEPTEDQILTFQNAAAKARDAILVAVAANPKEVTYQRTKAVLMIMLYRAGFTDVESDLNDVFVTLDTLSPQHPNHSLLQAEFFALKNDRDGLNEAIKAALVVRPNHFPAYSMAIEAALSNNDPDEAVSLMAALATWYSDNQYLLYEMGLTAMRIARPDEAIIFMREALRVDSEYADAKFVLALLMAEQGNTADALALLRSLVADNGENVRLTEAIAAIENGVTVTPESVVEAEEMELQDITTEEGEVMPDGEVVTTPNTVSATNTENE